MKAKRQRSGTIRTTNTNAIYENKKRQRLNNAVEQTNVLTPPSSDVAALNISDNSYWAPQQQHAHLQTIVTPVTSPKTSHSEPIEDEVMMDEDPEELDIDPASEYYHINMTLHQLHAEREQRRLRQKDDAAGK